MKLMRWAPIGLLLALPIASQAFVVTLNTTSGGYTYKAEAEFLYAGSTLTVELRNTQTSNAVPASNAQVLTGLFWDMNVAATDINAVIGAGSFYVDGAGNVIGTPSDTPAQHWAWKAGVPQINQTGTNFGVGAAGFGHFGDADAFSGGGSSPVLNGVDWGLLGGNWNIGGNQSPLIVNEMIFTFNVGTGFDLNSIDTVLFQYGSDLSEFRGWDPEFPPDEVVPEPTSIAMVAFAGAAVWARRRKNRK